MSNAATSQLQGLQFTPELELLSGRRFRAPSPCEPPTAFSGFLPPPKNMSVSVLDILNDHMSVNKCVILCVCMVS